MSEDRKPRARSTSRTAKTGAPARRASTTSRRSASGPGARRDSAARPAGARRTEGPARERAAAARPSRARGDERLARAPRRMDGAAPRTRSDRPAPARRSASGVASRPERTFRPRAEGGASARPRTERPFRPRPEGGESARPRTERPYRPRTEGGASARPRTERPYQPRTEGGASARPRTERPYQPRAEGGANARARTERPYRPRAEGGASARPRTERAYRPRPEGAAPPPAYARDRRAPGSPPPRESRGPVREFVPPPDDDDAFPQAMAVNRSRPIYPDRPARPVGGFRSNRGPGGPRNGPDRRPGPGFDRPRPDRPFNRPPGDRRFDPPAGGRRFDRPAGDRPTVGRPDRGFDRPRGDRNFDRPRPDRPFNRPAGDRPYAGGPARDRNFDRPRPDRPSNRPPGDRPYAGRPERGPDRPRDDRAFARRPEGGSERPRFDRPRPDRPFNRPSGERPVGARPERGFDRPRDDRGFAGPRTAPPPAGHAGPPRRDDRGGPRRGFDERRGPRRDSGRGAPPPRGGETPVSAADALDRLPRDPREAALRILFAAETRGAFSDRLLDGEHATGADDRDRALLHELVKGTLRWRGRIDWILDQLVHVGLDNVQPWIRNVLRLGAYQILFLDRIPPHAAVDESVKLAHRHGHPGTAGLVNSVLRRLVEEKDTIAVPEGDDPGSLSAWGSHPQWLVERWLARFGLEATRALMLANNRSAVVGLRVNPLRATRDQLIERLARDGYEARPGTLSPDLVWIEGKVAPGGLGPFREGWCTAQDESEALVGRLVGPERHERLLDLCAAPGGKCTHLAELMGDEGEVWAMERAPERVASLEATVARLGCHAIHVVKGDGRTYTFPMPFDRVLVDAPCSGLGVLARRADARWRKGPDLLAEMPTVQLELLSAGARRVRPGGVLVYSVCSFEPEETDWVVQRFLLESPGFTLESAAGHVPDAVVDANGFMRVLPHVHGCDGAFAARFRRA